MKNDIQRGRGVDATPRIGSGTGGLFSARMLSGYMRIVSSGASTAASTLLSAGASIVSSIANHDDESSRDQVIWAGFDQMECDGNVIRKVLLLSYKSGFQVWDVEQSNDVKQLASVHDGPVSFMQVLKKPIGSKKSEDKFSDFRPLVVVVSNASSEDTLVTNGASKDPGDDNSHIAVRFYSLRTHEYVNVLKFRSEVYSIRCSSRVVAVSQASQIHCLDAATLERECIIITLPWTSTVAGSGGIGYGPLAVGSRWLAYSGLPVTISSPLRVSPQTIVPNTALNGSAVAHYAKESSKQIAAGIVALGDIGYRTLTRYCSEIVPSNTGTIKLGSSGSKSSSNLSGPAAEDEYAGTVIVWDVISKIVVVQFRAHKSPISALCFDPSGILLVTSSIHGQNINVFRIIPSPNQRSSEGCDNGKVVHLYRLQRGITNAVIKDICFSDDSEWIMISSSRGTSHLFAISPYKVASSFQYGHSHLAKNNLIVDPVFNTTVRRAEPTYLLSLEEKVPLEPDTPVTLSVVGRIRNGTSGLKGAVRGAAAFAMGTGTPFPGAIASVFCHQNSCSPSAANNSYYLLVFSPSGSVIQYVLHRSSEQVSGVDLPGLNMVSHELLRESETKFSVEALQKWDICYKRSRRDLGENVEIFDDHGKADNTKLVLKGSKKGTSVYPSDSERVGKSRTDAEENHHSYISEIELQTHATRVPLWSKPGIRFHVMMGNTVESDVCDAVGGEFQIERVPTRVIEARSKDLIPVFESYQQPKTQRTRVNALDTIKQEIILRQSSELTEEDRCSFRSNSTFDGAVVADTAILVPETRLDPHLVEDSRLAVNSMIDSNVQCNPEHVYNSECLMMAAQDGDGKKEELGNMECQHAASTDDMKNWMEF